MAPIVEFVNVTKTYAVEGSDGTFDALNSVSFTIDEGSISAIIGGSGTRQEHAGANDQRP